jgi:hypothetical protein
MARRVRLVLIAIVVVLYLVSVPWYREAGEAPAIWLGLPDWVAVALGCYLAAAVLNAVAWLLTDVPEEAPPSESTGGRGIE